jgi:hypothetical protein
MYGARLAVLGKRPAVQGSLRLLASGSASAATVTTGSFTPTAGALILALANGRRTTSVSGTMTFSDSLTALTWTSLVSTTNIAIDPRLRLRLQWATAPAAPAAMTVTAVSAAANAMTLQVFEITGSGTPTNVGNGNDSAGDPSVSLALEPRTSSTVMLCGIFEGADPISAPTGFTEVDELTLGTMIQQVCARARGAATTVAYASTNTQAIGAAVEIPASTT